MPSARSTGMGSTALCTAHSEMVCFFERATISSPFMSVVITTYTLASGLMQQGMTWWQAMLTILLGNVIVLIPMILNAHAGTKYGVSFPVLCRASFGVRGANIPAILRALVACGWFGIQTWIGALALNALIVAAAPA